IAGAGNRLSLLGLHETGDRRFKGAGSRILEIGLNLVGGSSAFRAWAGQATERRSNERAGLLPRPSRLAARCSQKGKELSLFALELTE
ncbi:MAG TPA: hypothetical protein VFW62_07440, partial [bacterium]|nr:hypothetical protein [bacterium]